MSTDAVTTKPAPLDPDAEAEASLRQTCWCGGRLAPSVHPCYGRCPDCHTLVLTRSFSPEELKRFYSLQGYWREHQQRDCGYPAIEQRAQHDLHDRIPVWHELLVARHPRIGRLLEIGCAHGGFLHYCRERGVREVAGIEVDEATCAFAREHFTLPHVCAGLFPDVALPFARFDAITGFDVIEHFLDPLRGLQSVAEKLNDGGVFLFQTPCHRGEGANWAQFKPSEHTFLYNEQSIRNLFRRAGLEVTHLLPGIFPDDMLILGRKISRAAVPPLRLSRALAARLRPAPGSCGWDLGVTAAHAVPANSAAVQLLALADQSFAAGDKSLAQDHLERAADLAGHDAAVKEKLHQLKTRLDGRPCLGATPASASTPANAGIEISANSVPSISRDHTPLPLRLDDAQRILFVRTDSIGDAALASSLLEPLHRRYPQAQLVVLCQQHVAELFTACPFVQGIICFERHTLSDAATRRQLLDEIAGCHPDVVLNSVRSRDRLGEELTHHCSGARRIAIDGDLCNISYADRCAFDRQYTHLIPCPSALSELQGHALFLAGLDVAPSTLQPAVWTTRDDEELADAFFKEHTLDRDRTFALFPFTQHAIKNYPAFAGALKEFRGWNFLIFGGTESAALSGPLARALPGKVHNLTGRTSLREMAALIRRCRALVGSDSCGPHLACAVGVPNVVVLGGGHPGRFFPYSPLTSAVAMPLGCSGCSWACSFARPHCLTDLDPAAVAEAIHARLQTRGSRPFLFLQPPARPTLIAGRAEKFCAGLDVAVMETGQLTVKENVPLVSVIVSTYASEKFLRACLKDLQAQTIADQIEIIVIDSGSPENERAIVEEFQRSCSNLRYLRTGRETLYAAWNRGVQMARGKYVTNANADDSHRADALELLVAALEAHPDADLGYGDYYTTHVPNDTFAAPSPSRRVQNPPHHPAFLEFCCVTGCHPMWRRTVFDKIGLFDPQYTAPGDYEFLLRFAAHGRRAVHVPQPLSLFFQNRDGLSFKSHERSDREFKSIQSRHRAAIKIERLFRVDPNDPSALALGWTALGNLALAHQAPWFDNMSQDGAFARRCYQTALRHDPENRAARYNLALATALHEPANFEKTLAQLPDDEARRARRAVACGRYELVPVSVPPATEPLEFGRVEKFPGVPACTDVLPQAFATGGALASPVRWLGRFFEPGEFSATARAVVPALAARIVLGAMERGPHHPAVPASLTVAQRAALDASLRRFSFLRGGLTISHGPATDFQVPADESVRVGWTAFPLSRISERWAGACQQMDEVWVPNAFQVEAFVAAGVPRSRLAVMPTPVDERVFNPAKHDPWPLPNRAGCNFLAFVDGSPLNGSDVLLAAYLREFSAADDVCLYLVADNVSRPADLVAWESQIRGQIQATGVAPASRARVEWLGDTVPLADRPRLHRAVDCLVSPRRGDASGVRVLEAMMMARPVIAPDWSGCRGLLDVWRALPLAFELSAADSVAGDEWSGLQQEWANPSERHLRELMRRVATEPETRSQLGGRARDFALANHSSVRVAELVVARLGELERGTTNISAAAEVAAPSGDAAVSLAWEGTFQDLGSLSHVNRELTHALTAQGQLQLSCVPVENPASAPIRADITVRHEWPPRWQRPASGAWVLVQPWEFGALPAEWVRELKNVDEAWVSSEYLRRVYLDSGVPGEKVRVVPNGIDPQRFHPDVPPLALPTKKAFKFLFVGGTIHRKGADMLLETFLAQFTADDEVCLVIKDFGATGVYAGQTHAEKIRAAQQRPDAPEILYLTDDLTAAQVAGLYTACDCLVHPYRGEGFALTVLEAMACGLPVVVTAGGATDDFATDQWAYRIPALRKPIAGAVGGRPLAGRGWLLEPDAGALGERLRWILTHRDQARAKGRAASEHVRREWTWEKSAQIVAARARALKARLSAVATPTAISAPTVETVPKNSRPAVAMVGDLAVARERLKTGAHLEAWNETQQALRARPFHPAAWLLLAEIAAAAGDAAQARRCAARALALAPKWKAAKQFSPRALKGGTALQWPSLPEAGAAPRLTVCLITKNEERFLEQCLSSVREVADQIVVVDTGSTDRTVAIAQQFGAEVHHFAWCDDFSAARNAALAPATGDWILILDADEALPPESAAKLRREIQNAPVMAYRLPIVDAGREAEGCHYIPRLFRNAPGLHFTGRIHEQLFPSLEPLRVAWGLENQLGTATLRHHGYAADVTRSRDKVERNLRLLRAALAETPDDPNLLMNLGLELVRSGKEPAGLEAYDQAWRSLAARPVAATPAELRETLLVQYATQLADAGCFRQLLALFATAQGKAADGNASLHYLRGLAALKLSQWPEAARQMRACVARRDAPSLTTIHTGLRTVAPEHCLALALARTEDFSGARRHFEHALQQEPDNFAVGFDHAAFLFGRGQAVEALQQLHRLAELRPDEVTVWQSGGKVALSRPEFLEVALDWTATAHGCFPGDAIIGQQRAETLLLAGRVAEALTLWREFLNPLEPLHVAAQMICEVALGRDGAVQTPAAVAVFVWIQRLVACGAEGVLRGLGENQPLLRQRCPAVAGQLDDIFGTVDAVSV